MIQVTAQWPSKGAREAKSRHTDSEGDSRKPCCFPDKDDPAAADPAAGVKAILNIRSARKRRKRWQDEEPTVVASLNEAVDAVLAGGWGRERHDQN